MARLSASFNINVKKSPHKGIFSDGDFDEIKEAIEMHDNGNIDIYSVIEVGDTMTIPLSAMERTEGLNDSYSAQSVDVVIVEKNAVDLASGGKCHFVWQVKSLLGTSSNMSEMGQINYDTEGNVGGWKDSRRRIWCNSTFYNALPSGFKNIIKPASIKTSKGNQLTSFDITTDSTFLPCEYNIFGNATNSVNGEDTVQWEWYKNTANRIKYINQSSRSYLWWLRSPVKNTNDKFCAVDSGGYPWTSLAYSILGLSPCGCI